MLKNVVATRFIRRMTNGRTLPCLIECEDEIGEKYELVVKYTEKLFEKEKNLAIEALVVMLASDLQLPISQAFVVELTPEFLSVVIDTEIQQAMQKSCKYAFGIKYKPSYAAWVSGNEIPKELTDLASQIAIFDQIIKNYDRRPANPNCLFKGDDLLIFDHELAFGTTLFQKQPWENEGLNDLSLKDKHIFAAPYFKNKPFDFSQFILNWKNITDKRFQEYVSCIPVEWSQQGTTTNQIINDLKQARDQIELICSEALKVFK